MGSPDRARPVPGQLEAAHRMSACRRCGSTRFHQYVDPTGAVSTTCSNRDCQHPQLGNAALVHDLLNGRPPAVPLARTCHNCGAAVLDAPLCRRCIGEVRRWLKQIPELARELDVTISKQVRLSEQQRVSGSPVPPMPMQPDAAETRDNLRAVLVSWVKFVDEETNA